MLLVILHVSLSDIIMKFDTITVPVVSDSVSITRPHRFVFLLGAVGEGFLRSCFNLRNGSLSGSGI